jgi:hypothetical protein
MCLQQTSLRGRNKSSWRFGAWSENGLSALFVQERNEDLDFMIHIQKLVHNIAEDRSEDFAPNAVRINTSIFSRVETI